MRSVLGSKRSRFFREPKNRSRSSASRKQRVKFRPRYAGTLARRWSKLVGGAAMATVVIAAGLWGGFALYQFGKSDARLRVKTVLFDGDIPDRLRRGFPVKENTSLLGFYPGRLEREALEKFPELDDFSVWRRLDRTVIVKGKYRTPVAQTHAHGEEQFLDSDGVVFPLDPKPVGVEQLPWIEAPSVDDRKLLLDIADQWKRRVPEFYSLVKKIETDKMRRLLVELTDDVKIDWGPLEDVDAIVRAKRIVRFRKSFQPSKTPASLLFVTTDRIVMDANWIRVDAGKK